MSLTIVWGKERFHCELGAVHGAEGTTTTTTTALDKVTLRELKEWCRDKTGVPMAGMRIVFSGAILKDESAALSSFGLVNGAKITLMGSKPSANDLSTTLASSSEEAAYIQQIQALVKKVYPVSDQVSAFEDNVARFKRALSTPEAAAAATEGEDKEMNGIETGPPPATTASSLSIPSSLALMRPGQADAIKANLFMTHRRLSELLTQSLISLDGVSLSNEYTEARKQRKSGIVEVQAWLDRVDRAQSTLK